MQELENKYIELLLRKCLSVKLTTSLLIHCDFKEHIDFAKKVEKRAKELGFDDVSININDLDEIHDYLKETPVEEIKLNPIIDRGMWDVYAKKGGAILFLNSGVPGLMNDIESSKIQKWALEREKNIQYYRKNVSKHIFPWCIAALPNERWAISVFGNTPNAYNQLYLNIMKMCMIDRSDPIASWDEFIEKSNTYKNQLNDLGILALHYKNSLGTDLHIGIPKGNKWINLDKRNSNGDLIIANMPSYEIFTTPDYRLTEGIVYSSRPLFYNGCRINDFYLIFKNGKVIECKAKEGQEILEQLIYENENAAYLGEVALVPYDSPISNTGIVFNTTLFDENASCHLALGYGFSKAFPNSSSLSDEELRKIGLNQSKIHVDFMIGTSDLEIEAETSKGKVLIFKNGNFNI